VGDNKERPTWEPKGSTKIPKVKESALEENPEKRVIGEEGEYKILIKHGRRSTWGLWSNSSYVYIVKIKNKEIV